MLGFNDLTMRAQAFVFSFLIGIFSVNGKMVATLPVTKLSDGKYSSNFSTKNYSKYSFASGCYLVGLMNGNKTLLSKRAISF